MLKKIILCFTKTYEEIIMGSKEYFLLIEEMGKHDVLVKTESFSGCLMDKSTEENQKISLETTENLYLSDDADTLAFLQAQGCYTIAVYHEGVSGLLSGTQYAVEGIGDIEWEYLYKIYQRFTGEPWEITQTKRCMLREMCVKDVDDLYELYDSPLVTRYMENLFPKKEQEMQYIQDYIKNVYEYYGFGTWLIHRKEDGRLIGRAGFHYRPGYEEVELGFVIGESYWRNGYAYEVCSHLMEIGKTVYEFDKVQALVKKENTASIGLLEKLGFLYIENILLEGEEYQRYLSELAISNNTTYNS